MRMRREEALSESDLESNEEAEGKAEQTGCDSETAIEWGKSPARVSERSANHHGDQHHAGNGSNAKDEKIRNGPVRIADFRQHQQSNRGRACKTMHQANGQWSKQLIQTEFL